MPALASTRRPLQRPPGQEMQVNVPDGLSGGRVAVHHESVADLRVTPFGSDLLGSDGELAERGFVI